MVDEALPDACVLKLINQCVNAQRQAGHAARTVIHQAWLKSLEKYAKALSFNIMQQLATRISHYIPKTL